MSNLKPNHTCVVCDTNYYACNDCDNKVGKSWRAIVCSPSHYQIYFIVIGLRDKTMSEDEAKSFLNHLGIDKGYCNSLRKNIQEILLPLFDM